MPELLIGLTAFVVGLLAIAISSRCVYEMWCFLREQKNKQVASAAFFMPAAERMRRGARVG
ncbi:hypothetical protein EV102420_37_00170 [Pseudescherichia vulneris NBRC 102420]|uniref:Uncharacterized protein n=1 Tax=Pseudescherichia vulneris NBRC 102420 TaxID=1115515 RepID=A0A090V882_PSEVU|nr:hypothetical protein EV102420_37_00170 [Pseudescherichia vulneris NBRC 102420]STQ59743.1 Uncharacterised protein [Pseudescherichia vulneris]